MKQNEIKKYTVKVSNNETEANYDFNKIEIAKAAASLFVLDDKYDTVMLIDNETNKGIHLDPMVDLTQEQRDKINNETITVDLDRDSSIGYGELSINDTIEYEYDFDLPDDGRIMRGYDWDHERYDETREFYGFGDAGGEFFDMAAFKDEMSLEEFLVHAKQLMHEFLREEVCTKFKFHGFDGILVLSI